jgi:hypothetical protein
MDENVLATAAIRLDESVTFGRVKPLHSTCRHFSISILKQWRQLAPRYRSAAFSETARQSRHGSQSRDQIFCPKKKPTGDNRRALATLP